MRLDEILLPYQKEICDDVFPRKIVLKARQIGFSFMIAYCCIKKAALEPDTLSVILSINERASQELLKKVKQWALALQIATDGKITYECNSTEVRLSNGSRICSIPGGNPDAGRGLTITGVLAIDEFAYIPHIEDVWQSVIPAMTNRLRGIQPEIIIGSTPASKNSLFGRIWSEDLNFKHFEIPIYKAVESGLKCDIEELHKLVPDPEQFSVEYECKWSNSIGNFIDVNVLDYYDFDGNVTDGYYLGVDFGYRQDSTGIAVIKVKDDVKHLENAIQLQRCDFSEQFQIIKELHEKYKFIAGYMDENGIGAAISEQIMKQICVKIKGYQTTGSNKTLNYDYLRNEIFNHRFLVNRQFKDIITSDFNNILKTVSETGKITYSAGRYSGGHSDLASAVVLALQAVKDNPKNIAQPLTQYRNSAFGRRISRL